MIADRVLEIIVSQRFGKPAPVVLELVVVMESKNKPLQLNSSSKSLSDSR